MKRSKVGGRVVRSLTRQASRNNTEAMLVMLVMLSLDCGRWRGAPHLSSAFPESHSRSGRWVLRVPCVLIGKLRHQELASELFGHTMYKRAGWLPSAAWLPPHEGVQEASKMCQSRGLEVTEVCRKREGKGKDLFWKHCCIREHKGAFQN